MAAVAWLIAHGGAVGLAIEITLASAVGGLLLWAAVRSRRDHEEGDP